MLQARRLGKRFGSRWIFRNVEIDLARGQCLVVLGPNGAGKSTLVKVLARLIPPSEGQVQGPQGDLRVTLGLSSIELAVYPALSVLEHLQLAARLRSCPDRAEELIDLVGLKDAHQTHGAKLSTGMKARLKLAMAVQPQPDLLILDEPGASLDEHGKALIEQIAQDQMKRGALVIATNDPAERRFAHLELRLGE